MNNIPAIFKHKLFKNAFVYANSNVIKSGIPFLLLPILTRYLTPADYGIIATFQIILPILIIVVGLNTYAAVSVNFFKIDEQELKTYIGNTVFITLISFVLTLGLISLLTKPLSHLLKFPESWLIIGVVAAFSESISLLTLTLWQVKQKPIPYSIFQIAQILINVSLSLFFVVVLGWKWQGRLAGMIITSIISALAAIFIIFKQIRFSFNKSYIKDALFFGIPLIPHTLAGWVMASIDRVFINSMVGVSTTGIYTVGYQVGMIIGLIATSFNQAWSPFLYEKLEENNYSAKVKIVKFTYLYSITIISLALVLSFIASSFLKFFVGEDFHSADKYVLWIALGYAANGMYFMVANYIFYVKKTYILACVTFSSALISITLNYFLIKANGAIGAAQSTTITFFSVFILTWILSAKSYPMPWFSFLKK